MTTADDTCFDGQVELNNWLNMGEAMLDAIENASTRRECYLVCRRAILALVAEEAGYYANLHFIRSTGEAENEQASAEVPRDPTHLAPAKRAEVEARFLNELATQGVLRPRDLDLSLERIRDAYMREIGGDA